jgi:hypothetical protein
MSAAVFFMQPPFTLDVEQNVDWIKDFVETGDDLHDLEQAYTDTSVDGNGDNNSCHDS